MKKSIIFVDDEPNIIQGLKRMLRSERDNWVMFFAGSGKEALDILSNNHIDIIVTDMRMPEMDGAELLEQVANHYPGTVRIVLSGHSDREMILRSTKFTHQFLIKPCDADTLKYTLERACLLQGLVRDEELLRLINGIVNLPSLPDKLAMLLKEIQAPDSSLKKIGDIIAQDVTMTARVLQMVNSAFFGLPKRVTNPQQAVTLLGTDTIKGLVLYVNIFSAIEPTTEVVFSMEALWRHSIMVGNIAKSIAYLELNDQELADEAFITGMLHDIGKLLLSQVPKYNQGIKHLPNEKRINFVDAEYELMGTSHSEVGAYLLGLWGFSDSVVKSVAYHHTPVKSMSVEFTPLTAVHVANALELQEDCIDLTYLESLNLTNKIAVWMELCNKTKKEVYA
ncbi:response regulator [Pelotomaculum isophthalicicum JI]|uniref:Stage 0 sporulation protein A homolog n=1 Tax=Pelotomaculum isophthalicicum JI TaxID=947010 RepID=A0A9X4H635_9FIRM|nr:response regulator [Pelotomaculum isophthalicicum]MDF9408129.1 response regulator [Pelotomaculum isophthalicicum JI]